MKRHCKIRLVAVSQARNELIKQVQSVLQALRYF